MSKVLLALLLLSSCAPAMKPLKGNYGVPFETTSKSNFETVWENIIDMFAKTGMGIKIIDKSSGFIVAQNSSTVVTFENKKGQPDDPKAWAITQGRYIKSTNKFYYPRKANVEWNIHIKKNQDSTTNINVNLNGTVTSFGLDGRTVYTMTAYSTGLFEKIVADRIK